MLQHKAFVEWAFVTSLPFLNQLRDFHTDLEETLDNENPFLSEYNIAVILH